MKLVEKIKENKVSVVGCIWILIGLVIDAWFHVFRGEQLLDSDMAAEMILADLLNKEHAFLLSKNWFYSTEVRVFTMQPFLRMGLWIFPDNWHRARMLGTMLMIILMVLGILVLFHLMDKTRVGIYVAALSVLPGGGYYFWQTLYGGFYLPYILFSLYSLCAVVWIMKSNRLLYKCIGSAILIILGIMSGLNGVRQLMLLYAPMLVACVLITIYFSWNKCVGTNKGGLIGLWIGTMVGTIGSLIGYLYNVTTFAKQYKFRNYGELTTISDEGSFMKSVRDFMWDYGFAADKKLVSFQGIASMVGILVGTIIVFAGIRLIIIHETLDFYEKIVTFIAISEIGVNAVILTYVNAERNYYQPVLMFGLILVVLWLNKEEFKLRIPRWGILTLFMSLYLFTSIGTVMNEEDEPYHEWRAHPQMREVTKYLQAEGYTDGIAEFWKSHLIQELSDGEIETWGMYHANDTEFYQWLEYTGHIGSYPEGKYFYLCTTNEVEENAFLDLHPELQPVYMLDDYWVFAE